MTRYESPISKWVICSGCGRRLRGQPTLVGGYLLRRHYVERTAPRVTECPGSRRYDHERADQLVRT